MVFTDAATASGEVDPQSIETNEAEIDTAQAETPATDEQAAESATGFSASFQNEHHCKAQRRARRTVGKAEQIAEQNRYQQHADQGNCTRASAAEAVKRKEHRNIRQAQLYTRHGEGQRHQ